MKEKNLLLSMIKKSFDGIDLANLLSRQPDVPRRTLQRWIAEPNPFRLRYRDLIKNI